MNEIEYQEMIAGEVARSSGNALNAYFCGACDLHTIITIDRAAGVTPMFMDCPKCKAVAYSRMYAVPPLFALLVNGEFYRPDFAEFEAMPDGGDKSHVAAGGLLFRPIEKPKPSADELRFADHQKNKLCALPYDLKFNPIDGLCPNKGILDVPFESGVGTFKICLEHLVAQSVFSLLNRLHDAALEKEARRRSRFASHCRPKTTGKSIGDFLKEAQKN